MVFPECDRLFSTHAELKRIHVIAAQALRAASATSTTLEEYRRLTFAANEAWIDAECARLEVEAHKRVHSRAN
jgi:hypothetical protein